uniref:Uncharacterized protein n=1 Tax=Salvator merianae TaxID=96440 RepID=A0A8D0BLG8_SALMN
FKLSPFIDATGKARTGFSSLLSTIHLLPLPRFAQGRDVPCGTLHTPPIPRVPAAQLPREPERSSQTFFLLAQPGTVSWKFPANVPDKCYVRNRGLAPQRPGAVPGHCASQVFQVPPRPFIPYS